MFLRVQPQDSLFFRDGKPFTMQEDNHASTYVLPPLSTLLGSLRSQYFRLHPEDLRKAQTEEDPTKEIQILGLYYIVKDKQHNTEDIHVIKPADLVPTVETISSDGVGKFETLSIITEEHAITSSGKTNFLIQERQMKNKEGTWLFPVQEFIKYLKDDATTYNAFSLSRAVTIEYKTGIKINQDSKTTQEGFLYNEKRVIYETRTHEIFFLLDVEIPEAFQDNYINTYNRLGGEARLIKFQEETNEALIKQIETLKNLWVKQNSVPEQASFVKLILQSPFPVPHIMNHPSLEELLFNAQPIVKTMPKPQLIGGFDMKTRQEKPLRKALPTASTYYFSKETWDTLRSNHAMTLVKNQDDKNHGYGLVYIGIKKKK